MTRRGVVLWAAVVLPPCTLGGQGFSPAGRWTVVGMESDLWDFAPAGAVTRQVPMPPAGSFRLEGSRLILLFQGAAPDTAMITFAGDTLIERNHGSDIRLTRITPTTSRTSIVGTWGNGAAFLTTYSRDGTFAMGMALSGTYTVHGDTVAVSFVLRAPAVTRFHVVAQGRDTTMVGIEPETRVLRRRP